MYCGGRVEWQGQLSNLTHTKCLDCGETNCQIVEQEIDDELEGLMEVKDEV
jgi:agmatine/peptidylarginine deiminase